MTPAKIFIASDWPDCLADEVAALTHLGYAVIVGDDITPVAVTALLSSDVFLLTNCAEDPECQDLEPAIFFGIAVAAGIRIILAGRISDAYKGLPSTTTFSSFEEAKEKYFEKISNLCYNRPG